MSTEVIVQPKEDREQAVFSYFIHLSGLPIIQGSVESRNPPEPDILCEIEGIGLRAFELTELVDKDVVKPMANHFRDHPGEPLGLALIVQSADVHCRRILDGKSTKRYEAGVPIDLICYTYSRTGLPDPDTYLRAIREYFESRQNYGLFQRVWFMSFRVRHESREFCELIWEKGGADNIENL